MPFLQQAMILIQSLASYEKNGIDSLVVCHFDELKKEELHICILLCDKRGSKINEV